MNSPSQLKPNLSIKQRPKWPIFATRRADDGPTAAICESCNESLLSHQSWMPHQPIIKFEPFKNWLKRYGKENKKKLIVGAIRFDWQNSKQLGFGAAERSKSIVPWVLNTFRNLRWPFSAQFLSLFYPLFISLSLSLCLFLIFFLVSVGTSRHREKVGEISFPLLRFLGQH